MKHLFLLLTLLSFSLTALAQQKVTGKVKGKHSASCVFFSPLFLPTFVASL